jgi:hypothetical protein
MLALALSLQIGILMKVTEQIYKRSFHESIDQFKALNISSQI